MAIVVLVVVLVLFARTIAASSQASGTHHEIALAQAGARSILETLQASDFEDIFANYNGLEADDPGGPGSSPGNGFQVLGLSPLPADADGMVGEIVFPSPAASPGQLIESLSDSALGTPRDLTGDGVVDDLDHSSDYRMLPVVVRCRWNGRNGPARYELRTILGDFQ